MTIIYKNNKEETNDKEISKQQIKRTNRKLKKQIVIKNNQQTKL